MSEFYSSDMGREPSKVFRKAGLLFFILIMWSFSLSYFFESVVGQIICCFMMIFIIRDKDKPENLWLYMASIFFFLYTFIGVTNFSTRRGLIDPEDQAYFYVGLFSLLSGLFIASRRTGRRQVKNEQLLYIWRPWFLLALAFPTFLSLVSVIQSRGFNLSQLDRFDLKGVQHIFIMFGAIPFSLCCLNLRKKKELNKGSTIVEWGVILTVVLSAMMLGYRNSIIGLIIIYLFISRDVISVSRVYFFGFLVVSFISLVGIYRRQVSDVLNDIDVAARQFGIADAPTFFVEIHFAFREGFGLSQKLLSKGVSPPQTIFFADLLTLAPGPQPSGGAIIADLTSGALQAGGLNPGLIGLSLFEFGALNGVLFLFLVAFFFGRMITNHLSDVDLSRVLSAISFYELLMLFHRGDLRLSAYFVLGSICLLMVVRKFRIIRFGIPLNETAQIEGGEK